MKKQGLIIVFFILFIPALFAQVTIGSGIPPEKAALLDMKTKEAAVDGSATTDENGGGLLLPRVELNNRTDLTPFITQGGMSDDVYSTLKQKHKGLIVYNLSTDNKFLPGIYYWDGQQWQAMYTRNGTVEKEVWLLKGNSGTDPNKNFLGTIDNNDLSIRTQGIERIRITKEGKIGIKTIEDPVTDLEVNGSTQLNSSLFLKSTPAAPAENVAPLVVDSNGKVYSIASSTGNTKILNYIKYTFSNLADKSSRIKGNGIACEFNTLIPTNDYTLVVVGYSFKTDNQQNGLKVTSNIGTYTSQSVYADKRKVTVEGVETEYWNIHANYPGGETASGVGGEWTIYCLAINNSSVKTLPAINFDMQGSAIGAANIKPEGL